MNVEIHIPAIRVEQVDDKRRSDRTTIETHTETTVVIREDMTGNPNFDHYLQPLADLLYDYMGTSGKVAYGGEKFNVRDEPCSIKFECYPEELREAAQQRAAEDWCHEVQVLAEWAYRAESEDLDVARSLNEALDRASDDNPDAKYRKEIGGGADLMEDTTDGSLEGVSQ